MKRFLTLLIVECELRENAAFFPVSLDTLQIENV